MDSSALTSSFLEEHPWNRMVIYPAISGITLVNLRSPGLLTNDAIALLNGELVGVRYNYILYIYCIYSLKTHIEFSSHMIVDNYI